MAVCKVAGEWKFILYVAWKETQGHRAAGETLSTEGTEKDFLFIAAVCGTTANLQLCSNDHSQ